MTYRVAQPEIPFYIYNRTKLELYTAVHPTVRPVPYGAKVEVCTHASCALQIASNHPSKPLGPLNAPLLVRAASWCSEKRKRNI